MNSSIKYYIRRIIVTGLIASPCYVISETIVLLFFVGLANVLPEGSFENVEGWVATLQLMVWVLLGVIGWFLSKLLIPKPKRYRKQEFKEFVQKTFSDLENTKN